MSKTIKEYLEGLISEYHDISAQLEESVRSANQKYKKRIQEGMYTPGFLESELNTALDKAFAAYLPQAAALNTRAKQHITSVKEKLLSETTVVEKNGDFAVRVNNALQFLRIEGKEITDETAAQILRDFLGDVETMQRFRRVVDYQIDHENGAQMTDAYGKTTFPLTFGYLEKCEMFMRAWADLEATVENLFILEKARTEEEYVGPGVTLFVPMERLPQIMAERVIIDQAKTVDAMAAELTNNSK